MTAEPALDWGYPRRREELPPGTLRIGAYSLRFANNQADLAAAQRLRFEVFNAELGRGLASSVARRSDEDEFDARCHHLLVTHETDGVVGTYRFMTAALADTVGFYSQTEFELEQLPDAITANGVELGRACVRTEHRHTSTALTLLWCGIARYLTWNQKRYLFGCCSVPIEDEQAAQRLAGELRNAQLYDGSLRVETVPSMRCRQGGVAGPVPALPRLFSSYLGLGARVCSPPAIDRDFRMVDFLLVLDIEAMTARHRRMFFRERRWDG